MNEKQKKAFRKSPEWLTFRTQEIKRRGLRCELLGTKLTHNTAQLHHLDPEHYDNLQPEKFKLLSPTAHAFVEFIALIVHGNKTEIPYSEELMAWIGPFLPKPDRTVDKYYEMMRKETKKIKDGLVKSNDMI